MTEMTAVSLFAGVGGFDLALERSGVNVVAAVEIDDAARGVLADQFPHTTLFTDVREVTGDDLRAAGFVPERGILTAGFPCQDLSVAGNRRGLGEGTRSGLFWEVDRLVADLHPAWVVLENVPGLLSAVCPDPDSPSDLTDVPGLDDLSNQDYEDFLAHATTPAGKQRGACEGGCFPAHGGAMGLVLGALADRGYGFAYRVLDAQHFGVPQRRRRVFIVGRAGGDARGPVEVLLEPEGRARHPAARGEAGPAIAARIGNGVGDGGGHLSPVTSATVSAKWAKGTGGPSGDEAQNLVPVAFDTAQITSAENRSNPKPGNPVPTLSATGYPHVAHVPASEGNHRRPPQGSAIPVALRGRASGSAIEVGEPGDPAFTVRTPGGGSSYPMVAHTLTGEGHDASEDGTGRGTPIVPMAFNPQTGGDMSLGYGEKPTALSCTQETAAHVATAVRRLTPLECERLQGFPDGWTATSNGKPQADAARYRQCGNAIAVPAGEWVVTGVVQADTRERQPADLAEDTAA